MTDTHSRPWRGAADVNGSGDRASEPRSFRITRTDLRVPLHPMHRAALHASAISDEVIDRRRYRTLMRTNTDNRPRDLLRRIGFGKELWDEDRRFPGLLIPLFGPTGPVESWLYRPDHPRRDNHGRPRKYEAVPGRTSVLDVHPFNFAELVDPTVPLWITEGIKKADALTSAGECAVGLLGVWNWQSGGHPLTGWRDVALFGREVIIAFDSDAYTNSHVALAMRRLGAWLRTQGTRRIRYVVPKVSWS